MICLLARLLGRLEKESSFFKRKSSVAHGGPRNGSGRKKGVPSKKTKAVIEKAEAGGIMPLDVMLFAMRQLYETKQYVEAAEIAKDAAPYCTPRLAALTVKGDKQEPIRVVEEFVIVDANPNQTTPSPP